VIAFGLWLASSVVVLVLALVARYQRKRAGNMDTAILLLLFAFVLWVLGGVALVMATLDYTRSR